jgi:hypothetical protein
MKASRFFRVCFLTATVCVAAHAQLVHLTFSEPGGGGQMLFHATSGLIPWDPAAGMVTKIEVFFDPSTATSRYHDGYFEFSDPSRNFWRAEVETFDLPGIPHFTLVEPLDTIYRGDTVLEISTSGAEHDGHLEFSARLGMPTFDTTGLPVPPLDRTLDSGEAVFTLSFGRDVLPVPDLAWAEGYGGFHHFTAEVIPFTPVPEPATYAAGAVVLAFLAILRTQRRRVSA